MNREQLAEYFNISAATRDQWKRRSWYYHRALKRLLMFIIPRGHSVLEVGSGTGDLLAALQPRRGLGIDISEKMTEKAREKYPQLEWRTEDAEDLRVGERFDYVVLSDVIGYVDDITRVFVSLERVTHQKTRVVVTYYNYLWEFILQLAELLHLKKRQPYQNWLSEKDIENMLYLGGFEVVRRGKNLLFPVYIPIVSSFLNTVVANLPFINKLCLVQYVVACPITKAAHEYAVSIIVPCRNERGNIEHVVKRVPQLGIYTEIIFVEKGSSDGTLDEIKRTVSVYAGKKNIHWFPGDIDSKGDKVRLGFSKAKGDILMILDADLTVAPEDLSKFYDAISSGRGEFINGSRLVYPLEKESMRFFNVLGNKFFSIAFSWLLGQRIKDTLCGTKVLFRKDYERIAAERSFFGNFDPFGDFDLLFGAAKLNLKIVEMPVRYHARTYGRTNIQRWRHGWLLLKMAAFAARKIKFR